MIQAMQPEFFHLKATLLNQCANRPVYYLPNAGNWGDGLIRAGTKKLLQELDLTHSELRGLTAPATVEADAVLLYGGGGGWSQIFRHSPYILRNMQAHFNRIIVLPSTYQKSYSFPKTIFFCRDRYQSQRMMPNALFCHDMAFYLGSMAMKPERDRGYFFRTDDESANQIPIPPENRDISMEQDHLYPVDSFIDEIARYAEIFTDRLHVAILGCLLGRKVNFYAGAYFKNETVYLSSMKNTFPDVHFVDGDVQDIDTQRVPPTAIAATINDTVEKPTGISLEGANQPPVSCICLTYGRSNVLEEAIDSFLRQDYLGPKELIVLNDYEGQTLTFAHPEVEVINLPKRLRTVGEKMNVAVGLASYDLLFVWDDDDIYLPHRLRFSIEKFEPEKGFFKPDRAWFWNNGVLSGPTRNVFHVGSCWSRDRFDAVRGYAAEGTGYDAVFEQRLAQSFPGSTATYAIRPEDIYYLYRWAGTGSYHMSGFGALARGQNIGHNEVETYVQLRASRGEIQYGIISLQPRWKSDYQQLVFQYIASMTLAEEQAGRQKEVFKQIE